MSYYMTKAQVTKVLSQTPGKEYYNKVQYHKAPRCPNANKATTDMEEITEDFLLTYAGSVKPCKCITETQAPTPNNTAAKVYPYAEKVVIWHCSDGRDFSSETEALWYELELVKKGRN